MLHKEIPCPECNGFGYISDFDMRSVWSTQCTKCRGEGTVVVPVTNGDLVRMCNDEQLVRVRFNLKSWAIYSEKENCRLLDDSPEDFLLWLRKETDKNDLNTIFDFINEADWSHPYLKTTIG